MTPRLHPDDLAALADLVAERVAARLLVSASPEPSARELLTAREVAGRFGVSAEWVRENADRLGVVRLGDGPRPRLRFDPEEVRSALTVRDVGGRSEVEKPRRGGGKPSAEDRERAEAVGLLPFDMFDFSESEKKAGGRRANGSAPATRKKASTRAEPTRSGSVSGAAGRAPRATTDRSQHG